MRKTRAKGKSRTRGEGCRDTLGFRKGKKNEQNRGGRLRFQPVRDSTRQGEAVRGFHSVQRKKLSERKNGASRIAYQNEEGDTTDTREKPAISKVWESAINCDLITKKGRCLLWA